MAVCRNLAMTTLRCCPVIYPTRRPLRACGQYRASHNNTEAAVLGTVISIVHEYRGPL